MFLFQGEGKLSRRNYRIWSNVPSRSRNWNTQLKNKQRKYTGQDIIRRGCSSCRRSPSLCSQPSWNTITLIILSPRINLSPSRHRFLTRRISREGEREKFSKWNYSIRARFYIIHKTHAFYIISTTVTISLFHLGYIALTNLIVSPSRLISFLFFVGAKGNERNAWNFSSFMELFQPFSIPVVNRHRYACISNRRGNSTVREENTRQFSHSFPNAPSFAKDGFF